ncbi:MAG: segregation/condensation protein A [Candidatus Tagabacteria bacterium]
MPYQIKLEKFEGPLGALLELIEKRKLSINEVSLADVTDQYINYLKALEGFPLAEVSNFVAIASTLMLIKSASLIPSFELTEEETGDIKDLERRLQIYARIRNFASVLGQFFGEDIMFGREAFLGFNFGFLEPKGVTMEKLHHVLKQIIANLPIKEILPEAVVKKTVSLEKKISEIISRIHQQIEVSFSDAFTVGKNERIEIIISFLAVLELIKRGFIMVEQSQIFDNIKIKKNT